MAGHSFDIRARKFDDAIDLIFSRAAKVSG